MSYFLDHEVDFFKSCRSVTVTLEGKNDPVVKTLQNKITRLHLRRHPCKNQTKMEIFMARVKNSNCLNFCTQEDLSKARKFVHLFSSNMFYFREKRTFRFHPPESMDRVITGRKLNTFARFAFQIYYIRGNLSNVCSFLDSSSSVKSKLCRN